MTIPDSDPNAQKIKEGYGYEFIEGRLVVHGTKTDPDALVLRTKADVAKHRDEIIWLLAKRAGIVIE